MIYLLFIAVSLGLFSGFLALTRSEARRGVRYFASERGVLDEEVDRWSTAVMNIHFPTFVRSGVRVLAARVVHDVAHGSLVAVRFVERMLTRAVRALRIHHATTTISTSTNPSSDFVATMKDFKEELRSGRKTEEGPGDIIEAQQ